MKFHRLYSKHFESRGQKIGGYPFYTQTDPREWEETYQEHNILLLQIDTDDSLEIIWVIVVVPISLYEKRIY